MPGQEEIFDVSGMMRLASVPRLVRESSLRTRRRIDARKFTRLGSVASHAVRVPLKEPSERVSLRRAHHRFDRVRVDIQHRLALRGHDVGSHARWLSEAVLFKPDGKWNRGKSCNEGAAGNSRHRASL